MDGRSAGGVVPIDLQCAVRPTGAEMTIRSLNIETHSGVGDQTNDRDDTEVGSPVSTGS